MDVSKSYTRMDEVVHLNIKQYFHCFKGSLNCTFYIYQAAASRHSGVPAKETIAVKRQKCFFVENQHTASSIPMF